MIDSESIDASPTGVSLLNPFPWALRVVDIRGSDGNFDLVLESVAIDRAVFDADTVLFPVAHVDETWLYDGSYGLPGVGSVVPARIDGEPVVLARLSRANNLNFSDSRILPNEGFGAGRPYHPEGLSDWAPRRLVSPFDPTLPQGKRLLVADGGLVRRPVADPADPATVVSWDYRAVAPCTAEDAIPILEPSVISPID